MPVYCSLQKNPEFVDYICTWVAAREGKNEAETAAMELNPKVCVCLCEWMVTQSFLSLLLSVFPSLTHLFFCLRSTLRCLSTPTWTAQRTVRSSVGRSGTVFFFSYLTASTFFSLSLLHEIFGRPPLSLHSIFTLKRQWKRTGECKGGERCHSSAWVRV